jgi:inhibitor of cysteine peptidase
MKVQLIVLCLMTAVLLSLPACSSATPKEFSADISSSGKDITMTAGDTLTITLESNATTGFSWNENTNIGDVTVIQQTDHKYQPPAVAIPGAGGNEIWKLKALKSGSSTISMEYRRPFEPNAAPTNTFTLTVIVR